MKHASSLEVFNHWNERRGNTAAPSRNEIDPAIIRHSLGDVFMLSVDFSGEYRFRLAGTRICALFAREMKGESFPALWTAASRPQVEAVLSGIYQDKIGAVAGVTGTTADGAMLELELTLLPLSSIGHARIRALGVLAAMRPPFWVGVRALTALDTGVIRHLNDHDRRIRLPHDIAMVGMKLRHGFIVHDGGKTAGPHGQAS